MLQRLSDIDHRIWMRFLSIGVTPAECSAILDQAVEQIRLVHEALA